MTNEEINKYIHREIMGEPCWHNFTSDRDYSEWDVCLNCKVKFEFGCSNPDYCSDDSPRRLLNEVVEKLIGFGRSDNLGSQLKWRKAPDANIFDRALKRIVDYELDSDASWILTTATSEQIARACVEAHKESLKNA